MILLNVESISKSFTEKVLFDNISFSVHQGDKIGIIGVNGTGKSSLLKILASIENPDSGRIIRTNNISIAYLAQGMDFDPNAKVIEEVFKGDSQGIKTVREYEQAISNPQTSKEKIISLSEKMDSLKAWELESEAKSILNKLGITDYNQLIGSLSGGQKKRVALASTLIQPSDLLVLDEPTNHLDNQTIEWLEQYLINRKGALLLVTHDRYFLDRVSNKMLELENTSIYPYEGNYSYYLEKKLEREEMEFASERKRKSLYRSELAWMKQGIKARGTRQRARVDRFKKLEESLGAKESNSLDIDFASSRLGRKIIELKDISKSYGDKVLIKDFSYTLLRDDRIGILGPNGIGKSTLLKIFGARLEADAGSIEIGETVRLGVFTQEMVTLDNRQRAIDYIKEGGEYISTEDGHRVSASQMMENFLFPKDLQWSPIGKLSGGEKRRLYLMRILMEAPNVLLLDEPTNDLDIETLTILEDYIASFQGAVIIVSHDRYLLDKIVDKVFVFEGDGRIKQYTGNYAYFLNINKEIDKKEELTRVKPIANSTNIKLKLSYNEKREWEGLDEIIDELESGLEEIDQGIKYAVADYIELEKLLERKEELEKELDSQMERWMYLSDKIDEIEKQRQGEN